MFRLAGGNGATSGAEKLGELVCDMNGMLWLLCTGAGRGAIWLLIDEPLAEGWLYGLSLLSMNSRVMAGPLLIAGRTGDCDSILGKSDAVILGVVPSVEVDRLSSSPSPTPSGPDVGCSSTG